MAVTTSRGSSRISVASAASMATSVPEPMAQPTYATANAGASLTPSPIIVARRPPSWMASTVSDFPSGSTSARTFPGSMPTRSTTARAVRSLSRVSSIASTPRARRAATAASAPSSTASVTATVTDSATGTYPASSTAS